MDLKLIANITDIPAVHNFIKSQEDDEWLNKNSSLFEAQKKANDLMDNNKERIPMVIEYLEQPGGERISTTMYINPSRINMSTQKVTSKVITRGGIFYHHWGDDHWQMQLSGTVGFAGMEGIKKLEQIYNMSGVLLAYGTNSYGPVYVDGTSNFLDQLAKGDFVGAVGTLLKGGVKNIAGQFLNQAKAGLASAITGKGNAAMRSSAVYNKATNMFGAGVDKINKALGENGTLSIGSSGSGSSFLGQVGGALLGNMISKRLGLGNDIDTQVVDFNTAQQGWADINDELEDPWRPRQIWIYFEDRVYIGHFDAFSYQRVAETPLINYEMRFTVIRQVIVTSFKPKKPEFKPAQSVTLPQEYNAMQAAKAFSGNSQTKTKAQKLVEFAKKTPSSINAAKLEILKVKETYMNEKLVAEDNGTAITDARISQLNDWASEIRKTIGLSDNDDVYGIRELTDQQRLDYYKLSNDDKSKNPSGVNDDAFKAVDAELTRIKAYISKLKADKKFTDIIRNQLWAWVQQIHSVTGREDSYASWEVDLKPTV